MASDIKKAIRIGLVKRDMQQKDLAAKLEVTQQTVSQMLAPGSDLRMETVDRIAAALDYTTSELVALGEE